MMDRRSFLAASAMGGAGLAGVALQPVSERPPMARGTLGGAIPERIGPYRDAGAAGVVEPPDTPLTRRVYSDVLTRVYADGGGSGIMLLAAAGSATGAGLAVHRPDQCFPAAGFEIESASSVPLSAPAPAGARAQVVTAVRADRREIVHYWVRVGGHFPLTAMDQRWVLIRENLAGVLPDARLLRISALSDAPAGDADTLARLVAFSRELLQALSPPARRLLLGA